MNEPTQGTQILSPVVCPGSTSHYSTGGAGGYHELPSLVRRDTLPVAADGRLHYDRMGSGHRRQGMLVVITADADPGKWPTYRLEVPGFDQLSDEQRLAALADNANWKLYADTGAGVTPTPNVNVEIRSFITTASLQDNVTTDVYITPSKSGVVYLSQLASAIRNGFKDPVTIMRVTPFVTGEERVFGDREDHKNAEMEELVTGDVLKVTVGMYNGLSAIGVPLRYMELPIAAPPMTFSNILDATLDDQRNLVGTVRLSNELSAAGTIEIVLKPLADEGSLDFARYYHWTATCQITPTDKEGIYTFISTSIPTPEGLDQYLLFGQSKQFPVLGNTQLQLRLENGSLRKYHRPLGQPATTLPKIIALTTSDYYPADGYPAVNIFSSPNLEAPDTSYTVSFEPIDENGNRDYSVALALSNRIEFSEHQIQYQDVPWSDLTEGPQLYRVAVYGSYHQEALNFYWPGSAAFNPTTD